MDPEWGIQVSLEQVHYSKVFAMIETLCMLGSFPNRMPSPVPNSQRPSPFPTKRHFLIPSSCMLSASS